MRSLKTLLLSLILLAAPAVFAQNPTQQNSVGNITATSASCTLANSTGCVVLPLPNSNRTGATITVTGTWTGTLNFIATNATLPFSSTWAVSPLAGGSAVTTATANGSWTSFTNGLTVIGVDASAMTGTATVTITSSTGGGSGTMGAGSIICPTTGGVAFENGTPNNLTCSTSLVFSSGLLTVGVDNTTAGTLQLSNGSSAAHTTFGSAATTSNTILGPATAIANGHELTVSTSGTVMTITDGGVPSTGTVTTTGSPVSGNLTGFSGATSISTVGTAPWQFGQDATSDLDCYGQVGCSIELFAGAGGTGAGTVFHPNSFFLTDGSVSHLTLSASGANLNLGSTNATVSLAGGFTATTGYTSVGNGVNPGEVILVGNTVNPALSASQFAIFGPPLATFTSWSAQFGSAIPANNHVLGCVVTGTNCLISDLGALTSGTVTSVGFTGGLISVATATTTPAFTVAGTSGGIPYFNSSTTWTSSGVLASNALVLGGGAGSAPATNTAFTTDGTHTLTVGVIGGGNAILALAGNTSGSATFTAPSVAGTRTNGVTMSNVLLGPDGTGCSAPTYSFSSAANTGMYNSGGGASTFCSSGTAIMVLASAGPIIGATVYGMASSCCGVSADVGISRPGAGVLAVGNGSAANTTGKVKASGYMSVGTKFTASGCSVASTVGGGTAGTFTVAAGVCTGVTVTMGDTATAPNGMACFASDLTTPANLWDAKTGGSTTTAIIAGTSVGTDTIQFGCIGY